MYGNAFNQYGGILYGIPYCNAFKHGVIVVLSRHTGMDCYRYRRVLCDCGNNHRRVFVAKTPGQTTITSPVPLGLGSFEVTCVALLSMLGVTLEAAFTATLLLRGFTLWLPMIPGLWLTKSEMR